MNNWWEKSTAINEIDIHVALFDFYFILSDNFFYHNNVFGLNVVDV